MEEEKGYELPPWLLTYGDMVTLLVTFFVMLISLSTINMDKFKTKILKVQSGFEPEKVQLLEDNRLLMEDSVESNQDTEESNGSFETEEQTENISDPEDMYNYLRNVIDERELSQFVDIEEIKTGCKLIIPAHMCFEKGESGLKREASAIFEKLCAILQIVRGNIVIDTNTEKIAKEIDLPINRAATICEYIISNSEIDPRRIAILGNHTNANDKDTIEINVQKK